MTLKELMQQLKKSVPSVDMNQTVMDALQQMADHKVSAVLVMEKDSPRGIFTEKDLVRCHIKYPDKTMKTLPIDSVMTSSLVVAETRETIEEAMAMMIRAGIRHLPVVDKDRICTMVCLEDLVRHHVGALTKELHYLKDYITNLQDAVHD